MKLCSIITLALALSCSSALAQTNPGTSPLSVAKGGSGRSSFTSNLPVIGNGTGALALGTRSGNTTQFVTGTAPQTATSCVSFDASGNLTTVAAACEAGTFTPSNASPSTQTIQAQLRKMPVTCEDYSGGCTTANVTQAIKDSITTGRCYQFNAVYTMTAAVFIDGSTLGGASNACFIGKGGLLGPASGTINAVLELKNLTGMTVNGNVTLNCNSNAYIGAGLKIWSSGGGQSAQFNDVGFSQIANCRQAMVMGDPTQSTLPISEINISKGFFFNVAQGIRVYSSNAVINVANFTNNVDPDSSGSWDISFTGTCSGTTLTVTGINSNGYLDQYNVLTGTGMSAGTYIVGQSSGTAGGNGSYTVNQSCTSSSNSITSQVRGINIWSSGGTVSVVGGETVNTVVDNGYLCVVDIMASPNAYGNCLFSGGVLEAGGSIARSFNPTGIVGPVGGGIQLVGNRGFVGGLTTTDLITTDSTFPGNVTVSGNRLFGTASRSGLNIVAGSTSTNIYFDLGSFGENMLQGYAGVSGGTQYMTASPAKTWTTYTPTVTAQTGTCTSCSATGQYYIVNKQITVKADVTVTTVGTAAGSMIVSLPTAATSNNFAGSSFEYQTTGKSGAFVIIPAVNGTSNMFGRDATGTTYFASGNKVVAEITYELP